MPVLRLHRLRCEATEDRTGADEVYLLVDIEAGRLVVVHPLRAPDPLAVAGTVLPGRRVRPR
jgi:hypothetical protein